MRPRTIVLGLVAFWLTIVLLASCDKARAATPPWPTGKNTKVFVMGGGNGKPLLICHEWDTKWSETLSCAMAGTPRLDWPPAGMRPSNTFKRTYHGRHETCRQWNAYEGLVARCVPADRRNVA